MTWLFIVEVLQCKKQKSNKSNKSKNPKRCLRLKLRLGYLAK